MGDPGPGSVSDALLAMKNTPTAPAARIPMAKNQRRPGTKIRKPSTPSAATAMLTTGIWKVEVPERIVYVLSVVERAISAATAAIARAISHLNSRVIEP